MSFPYDPDTLTRADVRVDRRFGWVTRKDYDECIGMVSEDTGPYGRIFRAQCSDMGAWDTTREGAVLKVLAIWNMHEKARAYDLASRMSARA